MAEPKRWNKNRGTVPPDVRHSSCRWLFGPARKDLGTRVGHGTDPALAKVRRMRYQIVRARDSVVIAGFDEAPNAKKKIQRFLGVLGDPMQKRYFVHRLG